jgi:hypothetical protein
MQMVNFWPVRRGVTVERSSRALTQTAPLGLSESMLALGIDAWSQIVRRVPAAVALASQRSTSALAADDWRTVHAHRIPSRADYTLFVPPAGAWTSALALSDAQLTSWIDAHLVPDRRLVLPPYYAPVSVALANGQTLTTWTTHAEIVGTGIAVNVIQRDVPTNGGLLQILDAPLLRPSGTS